MGTYTFPHDQFGGTIGFCKKHGGYLSVRTGEFSYDSMYGTQHASTKGFGGGYLKKINNWLYFQGGFGYIYAKNHIPGWDSKRIFKHETGLIEGGILCRISKQLTCSILYTSWLDYEDKFRTATIGLGIVL